LAQKRRLIEEWNLAINSSLRRGEARSTGILMIERALGNDPNEGNHFTKAFSHILVNVLRDVDDDSASNMEALEEETDRADTYIPDASAVVPYVDYS
jgi:hypothetical protein